jgi:hypothetical protein
VAQVDAALGEQVLDVPQRQREPHVHHHHQADHLRGRIEVAEWAGWFAEAGHDRPLASGALKSGAFALTEPLGPSTSP